MEAKEKEDRGWETRDRVGARREAGSNENDDDAEPVEPSRAWHRGGIARRAGSCEDELMRKADGQRVWVRGR